MRPDKIEFEPKYKYENGVWVLDLKAIMLPRYFVLRETNVVYFPPGKAAGNHAHSRTEIFIGVGKEMELIWLDKDGKQQVDKMNTKGRLQLFKIPPFLPHAVRNSSKDQFGILLEFANASLNKVEMKKVV